MLLQFGGKKYVSKVTHLSGDRQFVPDLFLIFALSVDSFPASCRLGIAKNVQKLQ